VCGRYLLTAPPSDLAPLLPTALSAVEWPNWRPRWNIAPTQEVPVLRRDGFAVLRWGLIPAWTKTPSSAPLINARAETMAEKPSFRTSLQHQRCLVPADGAYEWATGTGQAYVIQREGGGPFWFAGLWARWRDPAGLSIDSVAIVTTAANPEIARFHHRMAVMLLSTAAADQWLTGSVAEATALAVPLSTGQLTIRPVGAHVNRVANDDARCLDAPQPTLL
jgi:putative SOS response-associated peptidase YedK